MAEKMGNDEVIQQYLSSLLARWHEEFEAADAGGRHDIFMNLLCSRTFWRTVAYMRRYPQRLTSAGGTYSDRCVGHEELQAIVTHGKSLSPDSRCFQWLDEQQIPSALEAENALALVAAHIESIENSGFDDPIFRIWRDFNLSPVEFEILSTLASMMSNEDLMKLMTVAWADFSVRVPTVSFLTQLLGGERQDEVFLAFRDDGILRQMQLLTLGDRAGFSGETPLLYRTVNIDTSLVEAFMGRTRQGELATGMSIISHALPMKRLLGVSQYLEEIGYALEGGAQNVCLCGATHSGRRTMLAAIVQAKLGKNLLEFDFGRLLDTKKGSEIEKSLAYAMREAVLAHGLLVLRIERLEPERLSILAEHASTISRLCLAYPSRIFILSPQYAHGIDEAFVKPAWIEVTAPTMDQSRSIWLKALSECDRADREKMATMFSRNYALPVGHIFNVVHEASDLARKDGDKLCSHHVLNEIRKCFRHQLGTLAEITVSDVSLSGVVLTEEAKAQVDEILEYAGQLHHVLDDWGFRRRSPYGNALSVLFSGPPGTGKTLLACALANELGKVLYRVDLSRIVDKYIGETEKNLGKIFDEAAKAQAIILFDEADSLFAKRTEVKSSNDRYANLEINFLLQKLESYEGVTILTTNLSKSIDEAFRRRIRFIVDFPMPDEAARVKLWKRMMPPHAPLSDDIKWGWLARTFEMSGGYIRNAVLKAAISAAAHDKPIDMECLARAAEAQARSMGQLLRISDDYDDDDDE